MSAEDWKYVVHAPGQQWLVDHFTLLGKVPTEITSVESPSCPRGKIFLMPDPESYLNTLKVEPLWPENAKEFAQSWHDREFNRLVRDAVTRSLPVLSSSSICKIESF